MNILIVNRKNAPMTWWKSPTAFNQQELFKGLISKCVAHFAQLRGNEASSDLNPTVKCMYTYHTWNLMAIHLLVVGYQLDDFHQFFT